jgi:hypothetical protein
VQELTHSVGFVQPLLGRGAGASVLAVRVAQVVEVHLISMVVAVAVVLQRAVLPVVTEGVLYLEGVGKESMLDFLALLAALLVVALGVAVQAALRTFQLPLLAVAAVQVGLLLLKNFIDQQEVRDESTCCV